MHTLSQILRFTFDWQIDVAVLYLVMLGFLAGCRSYAIRHGARTKFSPAVCLAALGLTLAGGLFAEWIGHFIGHSTDAELLALFTARSTIWGVTAYAGWTVLWSAARVALPRARLHEYAGIDRDFHPAKLAA